MALPTEHATVDDTRRARCRLVRFGGRVLRSSTLLRHRHGGRSTLKTSPHSTRWAGSCCWPESHCSLCCSRRMVGWQYFRWTFGSFAPLSSRRRCFQTPSTSLDSAVSSRCAEQERAAGRGHWWCGDRYRPSNATRSAWALLPWFPSSPSEPSWRVAGFASAGA